MDIKYLDIVKAPVITEKSANLAQKENKYVFKTDYKANKTQIKNAVEKIFGVHVEGISTIQVKPRKKRVGRYSGLSNKYKKAVVQIREGETIDIG